MPEIIWKGNKYTNYNERKDSSGKRYYPFVIVDHISAGSMNSLDSWFTSEGNNVSSAHFGVAKDGRIHQYVKIEDMAWANGLDSTSIKNSKLSLIKQMGVNPNLYTVSIEHEGTDGDLTESQLKSSIWLHFYIKDYVKKIWDKDFPLDKIHVLGHFQISPIAKPLCPGPKFPWDILYKELLKGEIMSKFKDTAGHWAENVIDVVSSDRYKFMNGYEDGTFKPDNYPTRAELAKILNDLIYWVENR